MVVSDVIGSKMSIRDVVCGLVIVGPIGILLALSLIQVDNISGVRLQLDGEAAEHGAGTGVAALMILVIAIIQRLYGRVTGTEFGLQRLLVSLIGVFVGRGGLRVGKRDVILFEHRADIDGIGLGRIEL